MNGNGNGNAIARAMVAMLRSPAMTPGWWLLVLAITGGTNLIDFFAAARPAPSANALFVVTALIRVILVFWLGYALTRRLAEQSRPMAATAAFGRFALFQIGAAILLGVGTWLGSRLTGASAGGAAAGIVSFLIVNGVTLLLVPLFGWQAALAVGDRSLGATGAWTLLTPLRGQLVRAYLIVAAVFAIHSALTRLALVAHSSATLTMLALVDGAVSGLQLALGCALSVVAWRLASERREALPPQTIRL